MEELFGWLSVDVNFDYAHCWFIYIYIKSQLRYIHTCHYILHSITGLPFYNFFNFWKAHDLFF